MDQVFILKIPADKYSEGRKTFICFLIWKRHMTEFIKNSGKVWSIWNVNANKAFHRNSRACIDIKKREREFF